MRCHKIDCMRLCVRLRTQSPLQLRRTRQVRLLVMGTRSTMFPSQQSLLQSQSMSLPQPLPCLQLLQASIVRMRSTPGRHHPQQHYISTSPQLPPLIYLHRLRPEETLAERVVREEREADREIEGGRRGRRGGEAQRCIRTDVRCFRRHLQDPEGCW